MPSPATPDDRIVGVLGATSLVGRPLLDALATAGWRVAACSRDTAAVAAAPVAGIRWLRPGDPTALDAGAVRRWIALCPLWAVPDHVAWLESLGIRSLVALSSTSLITKRASSDPAERAVATRLAAAESRVTAWAADRGVELCLLRPTMIYDGVTDGNVATIAAFIRRRGWFPVAGPARGLRRPVHAGDVATACVAAVERMPRPSTTYTLSGRDPLPFCDLVAAVFRACGLPPRIVHVPRPLVAALLPLARRLGIAAGATSGMAARMNEDLDFDHAAATADLAFRPRPFTPVTRAGPHRSAADGGVQDATAV